MTYLIGGSSKISPEISVKINALPADLTANFAAELMKRFNESLTQNETVVPSNNETNSTSNETNPTSAMDSTTSESEGKFESKSK